MERYCMVILIVVFIVINVIQDFIHCCCYRCFQCNLMQDGEEIAANPSIACDTCGAECWEESYLTKVSTHPPSSLPLISLFQTSNNSWRKRKTSVQTAMPLTKRVMLVLSIKSLANPFQLSQRREREKLLRQMVWPRNPKLNESFQGFYPRSVKVFKYFTLHDDMCQKIKVYVCKILSFLQNMGRK